MITESTMHLGRFDFTVERAEFCYIDRGLEPVVWDLNIYGHCVNDDAPPIFPAGLMLAASGIPLTLSPTGDYTGFTLFTPAAAYRDSGQSYFSLWAGSEHETWDVYLRLVERRLDSYLVKFQATTSFVLEERYEQVRIFAWAENVPPRSEPKTDYTMWLRPGPER